MLLPHLIAPSVTACPLAHLLPIPRLGKSFAPLFVALLTYCGGGMSSLARLLLPLASGSTVLWQKKDAYASDREVFSMARGRTTTLTIRLTPTQRRTLLPSQRATTIRAGLARRGRIILLVADRMAIADVAATVGISRRFVYKWVQRVLHQGLEGLADQPGRGAHRVSRQPAVTAQHDRSA